MGTAHRAAPDVFSTVTLGPVTLRNRIIKSATFEGVTPDGLVTDRLIEYHRVVAAGGVGMTTVAYLAVAAEGRTERRQIHLRPAALPGLRRLTDAIHAEGAAVSAQIGHAGPVADARSNGLPAISPSRRFHPGSLRFTRRASEPDIARITADHAEAAALAVDAGFDAVELHFGHNYLISAFLSPRLNPRTDRWGGSLENRSRFARQVARAVRDRVGNRIAVLAKFNVHDGVSGGFGPPESVAVARMLQDDGALDALVLTGGSSLLNPMYLFRGAAPIREFAAAFPQPQRLGLRLLGHRVLRTYRFEPAYFLPIARQFRAALTMPVVLLGGITDRASMDVAMAEGFDCVAMARALLREPDLVDRIRREPATPSLCIHCNRCMPTIYSGTRCTIIAGPR